MKMSDVLIHLIGARDPNCPDEAQILGYSENQLSSARRTQLEWHFAECDDCRELLAIAGRGPLQAAEPISNEAVAAQTARVLAYIEADNRKPIAATGKKPFTFGFPISYPKLAAVGVVLCAIIAGVVVVITTGQSRAEAAMQALQAALKDQRRTQARVSGNFAYSPMRPVTRGGDQDSDDLQFSLAELKLRPADSRAGSVDDRLMLARVYLARGDREHAKLALAILNELAARGLETPEALNDTGVAHFTLGNYGAAIEYFTRALEKSPGYGEALFNRALAEQRASRDDDARRDWQQFIDKASDERWKAEARMQLKVLDSGSAR